MSRTIYTARWIRPDDGSWKRFDIQPMVPVKRKGLLAHLWQALFKRTAR